MQVKKALELYEQLRQRMGVVVIGPSGSGKSTIWKVLRLALGKVGQTVKHYTMNPKAMPRTQVSVVYFILLLRGCVLKHAVELAKGTTILGQKPCTYHRR